MLLLLLLLLFALCAVGVGWGVVCCVRVGHSMIERLLDGDVHRAMGVGVLEVVWW